MIFKKDSTEEAAARALAREIHGAHYYTAQGKPRYTRDDGKPVTLREARKEKLFPSITHIFNVLESRPLTIYREKQLLAASYNLRPNPDEAMEDYFSRVIVRAREDSKRAASVGTNIHAGIEAILKGDPWDKENPRLVLMDEWLRENVEKVFWMEKSLVNPELGLAGRCDAMVLLNGFVSVVDWKTRRFKELKSGWKCQWYKKDVRQLAFYVNCVARESGAPDGIPPPIVAVNVAINTKEMSPVETRTWSITEQMDAMKAVAAINQIWQDENNFNPTELQIIEDDE